MKRASLVLILACFMPVLSARGESPTGNAAQAAHPPAALPAGVTVKRDVPYVSGGSPNQSLDLYLPDPPDTKPRPLIVWIHGGGWRKGSKSGCDIAGMVNEGFVVASVEYRFSSEAIFPAQIQDCQAAIRWLRANSKQFGIDPERVGVMGGSAGGHLAALLGTSGGKNAFAAIGGHEDQSDRIQAVVNLYGPADFRTVMDQAAADTEIRNIFAFNTPSDPYSSLIGVPLGSDSAKSDAVSPIHYVSPDNPPILIFHGTKDALVPLAQSTGFAAALEKAGVDVTLKILPGAGHGGPQFKQPAVLELITAFFARHLKGVQQN